MCVMRLFSPSEPPHRGNVPQLSKAIVREGIYGETWVLLEQKTGNAMNAVILCIREEDQMEESVLQL